VVLEPQAQSEQFLPLRKRELTTPDLVLLSLLTERPRQGYEANAELERRKVRDWAGISRPQVYYSIKILAQLALVRTYESKLPAWGRERSVFQTTAKGYAALSDALEREKWATHRGRPPFLTWIVLSWQAKPGVFRQQIERRKKVLENELSREEATLPSIKKEVGHRFHEAVWTVSLMIERLRGELHWLRKLKRELPRRAAATHRP